MNCQFEKNNDNSKLEVKLKIEEEEDELIHTGLCDSKDASLSKVNLISSGFIKDIVHIH